MSVRIKMIKRLLKENKLYLSIMIMLLTAIILGFIASFRIAHFVPSSVISNFTFNNSLPDGANKKATVILLNGQSNASGVGSVSYLEEKSDTLDYAKYESGYDNVLINYFLENGGHSSNGNFVPTSLGQGFAPGYIGPELGLADHLNATYPDDLFIILKYAWGGSNLHTQWRAPSSFAKAGELYAAFINFTSGAMNYLISKHYDAQIKAMCWMQGESDAFSPYSQAYKNNLTDFVDAVRSDLDDYTDELYFVDAGISDSSLWTDYQIINQAKSEVASLSTTNRYIDTIVSGLEYDKEPNSNPDIAHYDCLSTIKLGQLFANEIIATIV